MASVGIMKSENNNSSTGARDASDGFAVTRTDCTQRARSMASECVTAGVVCRLRQVPACASASFFHIVQNREDN